MNIKTGSKVGVSYTGTLDDGTVFDSSEGHEPLAFEVGSGQVISGFDNAVLGMKKDEEKTFTVGAKDAYGEYRHELVKGIPRNKLPPSPEPKPGMILGITLADSQQIPALIVEVTKDEVKLDLNHPLAGKNLTFKIKIVDVN